MCHDELPSRENSNTPTTFLQVKSSALRYGSPTTTAPPRRTVVRNDSSQSMCAHYPQSLFVYSIRIRTVIVCMVN